MTKILIVEDETRIASLLQRGLRKNGFQTTIASEGQVAVNLLADEDFDLCLLDLGLPDIDGLEVLAAARARGFDKPVIVVTARDEPEIRASGLRNGANDYVTKPFRFRELLDRIHDQLPRD
ncbi:MAG: response regulator [Cyanobacteria bacterium J06648_11]